MQNSVKASLQPL